MMDSIEVLQRILKNNSPLLFLGAGFPIGAKLSSGIDFPKGDSFKVTLIEKLLNLEPNDKDYSELMSYTLSQVCQYAKMERGPNRFLDFVVETFKNGIPNAYHSNLTDYPWRRIYTTNIDDIVETVFKQNNIDILVQNTGRKSTLRKEATEYIKLHGCVNNPSKGIIFSADEYTQSMLRQDYGFSTLTFDLNTEDFIFLGSEFEEPNIRYFLEQYEKSYDSNRGKVIFINPGPSLFLRAKIKNSGAILIEWTGEQFMNFIDDFSKKQDPKKIEEKTSIDKSGFSPIKRISNADLEKQYDSDLYLGNQPKWEDVFFEWDFRNADIIKEFDNFMKSMETHSTGIFSLYGKAFSGKSVYIRRLAVELLNRNFEVFHFKGRVFSYFPFFQQIKNSDSDYFALIMDDASYHYKPIKQLSRLNLAGKKLIIITTSRPFYHYRKRYQLVEENYTECKINSEITPEFAKVIVKKLTEKGFLGELKKYKSDNEKERAVLDQNDVFSLLSFITQGSGFTDRWLKEIIPLLKTNPIVNDLLLKTAIFEELDLPYLPMELISLLYGDKTGYIISQADDFLKFNANADIQFRAKFYSNSMIRKNSKKNILKAIEEILISISPQIPDSGLKSNSYWHEIQEALTKQRLLKNIFQFTNAEIKQLLLLIQNYYSNNSHFWLQLGIVEQNLGQFEKALNHFKQSEALNSDSYIIQHAIGRNYMKQANAMKSRALATHFHNEGTKILKSLIENDEEYSARAFSTHSYLYEELKYIENFNVPVSNHHLKKLFQYLQRIVEKDTEDVMSKHMSNYFYKFLQRTNRLGVINLNFRNLNNFKEIFKDYNVSIEQLLEDQDF